MKDMMLQQDSVKQMQLQRKEKAKMAQQQAAALNAAAQKEQILQKDSTKQMRPQQEEEQAKMTPTQFSKTRE